MEDDWNHSNTRSLLERSCGNRNCIGMSNTQRRGSGMEITGLKLDEEEEGKSGCQADMNGPPQRTEKVGGSQEKKKN